MVLNARRYPQESEDNEQKCWDIKEKQPRFVIRDEKKKVHLFKVDSKTIFFREEKVCKIEFREKEMHCSHSTRLQIEVSMNINVTYCFSNFKSTYRKIASNVCISKLEYANYVFEVGRGRCKGC